MFSPRAPSVAIVTAGALVQMVLQLGVQILLAGEFGATAAVDALVAATTIPIVLAGMIGVPLGAVLIPVLSRERDRRGARAAAGEAGRIGLLVTAVSVFVAGLLCIAPAAVIDALYPGLSTAEVELGGHLLWIAAWLIPANVLTAWCQSLHNAEGRFLLPAVAGVVGPAVTVALILLADETSGIVRFAVALIAGAAVNVAVQAPGLARSVRWPDRTSGAVTGTLRLAAPLLLGSLFLRIDPLVDRSLGSFLDEGTLAHLAYSHRLVTAMLTLTVGGLSVVAFPLLARAAASGRGPLAEELSRSLKSLILLVTPMVIAFAVFAPAIVRDVLEYGEFTRQDTESVATLVRFSLGIVIGGSLGEICARAFYADHDTTTPTLIGVVILVAAIALKVLLVPHFGVVALVAASSAAYALSGLLQAVLLVRRLGRPVLAGVAVSLLRAGIAAAVACGVGAGVLRLPIPLPAVWGGAAGLMAYAIAQWLLPGRERALPRLEPQHPDEETHE
jgi:putative peptidoglycan lipid II flippase